VHYALCVGGVCACRAVVVCVWGGCACACACASTCLSGAPDVHTPGSVTAVTWEDKALHQSRQTRRPRAMSVGGKYFPSICMTVVAAAAAASGSSKAQQQQQ
jgi:hypothetical protein